MRCSVDLRNERNDSYWLDSFIYRNVSKTCYFYISNVFHFFDIWVIYNCHFQGIFFSICNMTIHFRVGFRPIKVSIYLLVLCTWMCLILFARFGISVYSIRQWGSVTMAVFLVCYTMYVLSRLINHIYYKINYLSFIYTHYTYALTFIYFIITYLYHKWAFWLSRNPHNCNMRPQCTDVVLINVNAASHGMLFKLICQPSVMRCQDVCHVSH